VPGRNDQVAAGLRGHQRGGPGRRPGRPGPRRAPARRRRPARLAQPRPTCEEATVIHALRTPLIAGSAAVLAAILGATAALAATTWTIKPGGAVSATATNVNFKNTKNGTIFTCSSVAVSGTLKSGSGLSGSGAGSVSAVTFTHC